MTKYTDFKSIPQFIESGNWECDFDLDSLFPQLKRWREAYGLDLDSDFQRLHIWTEEQQVAWLKFFLRGGKTGKTLYFNCAMFGGRPESGTKINDEMVLVDGKQRLESLRRFVYDELEVFGSKFSEFTDRFRAQSLKINMNVLKTRAEVIRWYIELNAGGTPHTAEEIEKAKRLLYGLNYSLELQETSRNSPKNSVV
jgi:hypothetical protein